MRTLLTLLVSVPAVLPVAAAEPAFRPPAVPLVTTDPYFSIWSFNDQLNEGPTHHWTGAPQPLTGLLRVDGKAYRLMGAEPKEVTPLPQTGLQVLPTRTITQFAGPEVRVTLTFTTPLLPDDLEVLARPATYLTWEVRSADGKQHAVSLYFDAGAELAVNVPEQEVTWSREKLGALTALKLGSKDQPVLAKRGDNLRIDWGYLYAAPVAGKAAMAAAAGPACRSQFAEKGTLPADDTRMPRPANDEQPVLALAFDLGRVGAQPASRTAVLAYDDLYGIQYFRENLRPFWRRKGANASDLLNAAVKEYPALAKRCQAFDAELMADLEKAGGPKYAQICALAYRQCLAANKLVADDNGQPLLFPKENFSNGCIATVDVIYPMAPQFLLFGPALTKAMLRPVMDYANSPRWRFPFAPHDLGQYPQANGQVYGGGERTEDNQMPVEETGNMLLILGALAQMEGNADFAAQYRPLLARWADYLKAKGFDPENQLCTDDFAGHLAHNVNLSAKAILALGAYGQLCEKMGDKKQADTYLALAKQLAGKWVETAAEGDHYRLAFDRPNTWSQKYNLVWDRILGLGCFPAEVTAKEIAFYKKTLNRYGLPLDNRQAYTKLDWTIWSATLSESPEDFAALVDPVYAFLNESPSRIPMSDWYWTTDGKQRGFQARSVVGGVFITMLREPALWRKWAGRDKAVVGNWAPMPVPPELKAVVPTSQAQGLPWRYTFQEPAGEWAAPGYDAGAWKEGPGGFGTDGTPGAVVRTLWNTPDIWMRREFDMPAGDHPGLRLLVHHDEDVEVYINGVLAGKAAGFVTEYQDIPMTAEGKAALKPGKNLLAVHCHQTQGGQYVDVGIAELKR